jgi:hypothetical protein
MLRRCLLAAALLAATPAAAQDGERDGDSARDAALVGTAIAEHIRPNYEAVAGRFAGLEEATVAQCATSDAPDAPAVREALAEAVAAWGRVQHLRFGPANEADRYLSVYFWPDPRDFAGRHLGELAGTLGDLPLEADSLAQMSVAVQGLPAFARVLADPPEALALDRCDLAVAIAGNLARMGAELAEAWQPGARHPELLTNPDPDNALYRSQREAALELFKALAGGLQFLAEQKLMPVAGESVRAARPERAPFGTVGLGMTDLRAAVAGLRGYYLDGGFSAAVAAEDSELDARIRQRFEQIATTLDAIEAPLPEAVVDPAERDRWNYVLLLAERLQREASGNAGVVLGYAVGFNAFDGD